MIAVDHPRRDDEARIVQRIEHVAKDARNGRNAPHFVERILEVRIAFVEIAQALQVGGRQRTEEVFDPCDGVPHAHSPVKRRITAK